MLLDQRINKKIILLFGQDNLESDNKILTEQIRNFKTSNTIFKFSSVESENFDGGKVLYLLKMLLA